jgi:hypothetical protein
MLKPLTKCIPKYSLGGPLFKDAKGSEDWESRLKQGYGRQIATRTGGYTPVGWGIGQVFARSMM